MSDPEIIKSSTPHRVSMPEGSSNAVGKKAEVGEGWQIVWSDAPEPKPGARVSKKRPPVPMQALGFVRAIAEKALMRVSKEQGDSATTESLVKDAFKYL